MNPLLISSLFDVVGKLFDRILPDPEKKAAAQLELLKMQQEGQFKQMESDLQIQLAQINVNTEEAKSDSIFKSGWRPAIGWICGTGLGIQFIVSPIATWGSTLFGHPVVFPSLDLSTLLTLLFGMLGLGAYRTVEKVKGAA